MVYDDGAVSFGEIHSSLKGTEAVYLLPPSAHNERISPLVKRVAPFVPTTGDAAADAARVREAEVDAIVTFSEQRLMYTALLAGELGLPFHQPETVELLTDKYAQRVRLREAGVDSVRSSLVGTVPELRKAVAGTVGLPAVLKPRTGVGSRDTHLVRTLDEAEAILTDVLDRLGPVQFVLEEYLEGATSAPFGDYVSVESLIADGQIRHIGVTGKMPLAPPFRETAQFWPSCLSPAQEAAVTRLVGQALGALGVRTGLTHTEVKLTDDGPRLIEINGRVGGLIPELYGRATGIDLVSVAAGVACGEEVELARPRPDRVHFQYTNPAPLFSCILESVSGVREVSAHPDVIRYIPHVKSGTRLDDGVMTRTLDMICGDSADHAQMVATFEEILHVLEFSFLRYGETVRLSGFDLTHDPADAPSTFNR
ncbi:acetyl-CoA carboxylase biotin carboxylase subunit family protein [Streptomyces goshikiensis]|uniref:ATP-grasp domain-containing protein n=1 Tax=Streptomyces goshikiensis TaxID=1942 RepID=UPI0036FD7D8A